MAIDRRAATALALSAAGLIGIATHEAYVGTATPPVKGDVPTVGFGHTGQDVKNGQKTTPERALKTLLADATEAEKAVQRCAPVPMTQYEFDAYTSLTFNIGETAFCNSTLAKKLNALDYAGSCQEILKWDKFHGKTLQGLTNRRQEEFKLCSGTSSAG